MPHISIQLFRSTSPASLACANSTPLAHTLTAALEFGIMWPLVLSYFRIMATDFNLWPMSPGSSEKRN